MIGSFLACGTALPASELGEDLELSGAILRKEVGFQGVAGGLVLLATARNGNGEKLCRAIGLVASTLIKTASASRA